MKLRWLLFSSLFFILTYAVSAEILDELHLNIQLVDGAGNVETGTYTFTFNITTDSSCANVVYTNSASLTTDSRGIISRYLPNVTLNFTDQYYLCTYRDGTLKDTSKIARAPYAFTAKNVSGNAIMNNSNINIDGYNITASYGIMSINWSYLLNVPALIANNTHAQVSRLNVTTATFLDVKCLSGEVLTSDSATGKVSCVNQSGSSPDLQNISSAWNSVNQSNREANYFKNENISTGGGQLEAGAWKVANQTAREGNYWSLANTTAREANYFMDGNFTTQFNAKLAAAAQITGLWSFADILVNGNIFIQGNVSQLNVTNLDVNGSLFPALDATFDIGSTTMEWRTGYFGTSLYVNDVLVLTEDSAVFKNENVTAYGYQVEANAWKLANTTAREVNYFLNENFTAQYDAITSRWLIANQTAREANYFQNANATTLINVAANAINTSLTAIGNNISGNNVSMKAYVDWVNDSQHTYIDGLAAGTTQAYVDAAINGNITTHNASMKAYVDNRVTYVQGNINNNFTAAWTYIDNAINGNITTHNASMKAYVDLINDSQHTYTDNLFSGYQKEASAFKKENQTNIFNQSLNTSDDVIFDSVTINGGNIAPAVDIKEFFDGDATYYGQINVYGSTGNTDITGEVITTTSLVTGIVNTRDIQSTIEGALSIMPNGMTKLAVFNGTNTLITFFYPLNATTINATTFFGNLDASYIQNALWQLETAAWKLANTTAREANYWLKANSSAYLQEFSFLNSTNVTSSFGVSTTMPGSQNLINFVWTNLTDTQSNISLINASVTAALNLRLRNNTNAYLAKLGIGISSPLAQLEVSGNANITGSLALHNASKGVTDYIWNNGSGICIRAC